jgi:hypothetical protein
MLSLVPYNTFCWNCGYEIIFTRKCTGCCSDLFSSYFRYFGPANISENFAGLDKFIAYDIRVTVRNFKETIRNFVFQHVTCYFWNLLLVIENRFFTNNLAWFCLMHITFLKNHYIHIQCIANCINTEKGRKCVIYDLNSKFENLLDIYYC